MGDALEIRRFTPADGSRVRELHERALRDVDAYVQADEWDADLTAIRETYQGGDGAFLVGELDGRVVAMGAVRPTGEWPPPAPGSAESHPERDNAAGPGAGDGSIGTGPATAELTRMRVAPAQQRRGFGTRILEALERRAAELGYERLVLDTTARQVGARRLYEGAGYEQVAETEWREFRVLFYVKLLE